MTWITGGGDPFGTDRYGYTADDLDRLLFGHWQGEQSVTFGANRTQVKDDAWNELTINAGVTLTTNGYRTRCGRLTLRGAIRCDGAPGVGAAGGAGGGAGNRNGWHGFPGGAGTAAFTDAARAGSSVPIDSYGGGGGRFADGAFGYSINGIGPGNSTSTRALIGLAYDSLTEIDATTGLWLDIVTAPLAGGAGGAGTSLDTAGVQAGGGGGGGVVCVFARELIIEPGAVISATGGAGQVWSGTDRAGGGGGGVILIVYRSAPNGVPETICDVSPGLGGLDSVADDSNGRLIVASVDALLGGRT